MLNIGTSTYVKTASGLYYRTVIKMKKYQEAKEQFQHALEHQQTISIAKLKRLMQIMNMSLDPSESAEVKYLKGEIQKLNKKLKRMKR